MGNPRPMLLDDRIAITRVCDELYVMWSAARFEANEAYNAWCDAPGTMSYAVYLAAEDRADAAERAYSDACVEFGLAKAL